MKAAWISLGANLGDREATLAAARERIGRIPGVRVVATSGTYESEAHAGQGGIPVAWPRFLNQIVEGRTSLAPRRLLWHLLRIEAELGRRREARPAPRTLDLDLLALGDMVIEQADLTLPHPRLRERRFLLEPLALEFPDWTLPGDGRRAGELLLGLGGAAPVRISPGGNA